MNRLPAVAQDFSALQRARRSIRAFLPEPLPKAVIVRIFSDAQWAPSNCNVQPWITHLVSGHSVENLRRKMAEAASSNAPMHYDFPLTGQYPGLYRERRIEAAKALFAATGVAREDLEARRQSHLRNFVFFDAPHVAFFFLPEWAGCREAADCGMYAQSVMLGLVAHGFGSCAQGALSLHADVVKHALGVSADKRLLFGMAFGRPDPDHPANQGRPSRASLAEALVQHD